MQTIQGTLLPSTPLTLNVTEVTDAHVLVETEPPAPWGLGALDGGMLRNALRKGVRLVFLDPSS